MRYCLFNKPTFVFLLVFAAPIHAAPLHTATLSGDLPVKTWRDMHNEQVVKQNFDYSCGAASLATILQFQYSKTVSEEAILKAFDKTDAVSFADMVGVLPKFGFKGYGIALDYAQLAQLKIPVVVYLRYRGDDHFSVLRGIDDERVWLADPSWGNRVLSKAAFTAMWHTREGVALPGKVLLVIPQEGAAVSASNFFAPPPTSHTADGLLLRHR